ncbi:hypothetical protein Aph02nite_74770 [Actinoplanes philippinensis]|nr:hypothetical protein Aph02nite_74770 [Actinoplanes philippinensis]
MTRPGATEVFPGQADATGTDLENTEELDVVHDPELCCFSRTGGKPQSEGVELTERLIIGSARRHPGVGRTGGQPVGREGSPSGNP